jgi:hypothetical protein
MAKVANAVTTYQVKGNREDLSDRIYNIDPFDTPGVSMIGRRNVKNRTYDWQTENLPARDPNNAQEEGFELVRSPGVPTVRQTNIAQISKRDATVSASQEASDAAGKNSEMAHQMALKSKALKCDVEVIAFSRQAKSNDDNTTGIRKTESIPHQVARAADSAGAQGTHVFGVTDRPADRLRHRLGGPDAGGVHRGDARGRDGQGLRGWRRADPAGRALRHQARLGELQGRESTQVLVGKTEVVATVDVIATDGGRVTAMPSRWMPADLGMLIDPEYARLAFFRNFRQYPIAKIGDAETRMIVVEWGTQVDSGLAHIVFNGITPTVAPAFLDAQGQVPRPASRYLEPIPSRLGSSVRTLSAWSSSSRRSARRSRCIADCFT